jgi:segregation and condensation protein B
MISREPEELPADAAEAVVETPREPRLDSPEEPALPRLPEGASEEAVGRVAAALVFASDRPLSAARLSELLGPTPAAIVAALSAWNERLRSIGSPFSLIEIAGGYRFVTEPALAPYVAGLRGEQRKERLSGASLETLAIVAYRQPVTKGEIEAMRGVQAGPILRSLLEKRLVRITGRAPVPGHPLQYGTTREFLDQFQLASIRDLPTVEELSKP